MEPLPTFLPSKAASGARSWRSSTNDGCYSPLALLCTAAGALLVGGALTLAYLRPRLREKDSPCAPTDAHQHWNAVLAARQRSKQSAAGASSVPIAGSGAAVELAALDIRPPRQSEVPAVSAQICASFEGVNQALGMGSTFMVDSAFEPTVADAVAKPQHGLIAVRKSDGAIMGSAFIDESDLVEGAVGCGPWTVKWGSLGSGVGRELITRQVEQSLRHGAKSMRLIQIAANNVSFSLYTSLGFHLRETAMAFCGSFQPEFLQQALAAGAAQGFSVREMTLADVAACDQLHQECNAISRRGALTNMFPRGGAESGAASRAKETPHLHLLLLDSHGRLAGYTTGVTLMDHTVAMGEAGFQFLIASLYDAYAKNMPAPAASAPPRPSRLPEVHIPLRLYPALTRWMLEGGARADRQINLMVLGEWTPIQYNRFVYCPSILF